MQALKIGMRQGTTDFNEDAVVGTECRELIKDVQ